jgi:hypothetical protein
VRALYLDRLEARRVRDLYRDREAIQLNPPYQRVGDVWDDRKRRLLIDSLINGFDIPKFYLRHFVPAITDEMSGRVYDYAVIDGQQRLTTLWSYLDDGFGLSKEFVYIDDDYLGPLLSGLRFSELSLRHPDIANNLLNYELDVITVETDEEDYIEDMFLRLNEAVPLNAAEKRNAYGGPIPPLSRSLASHQFFLEKVKVTDRRYRYYELATKFLYLQDRGEIRDMKKAYLDRYVAGYANVSPSTVEPLGDAVRENLDFMATLFNASDYLLDTVGMLPVYYSIVMIARTGEWLEELDRSALVEFNVLRNENRFAASSDESSADANLVEFERFAQSPNDAIALRFRRDVLLKFLGHPNHDPMVD